MANLKLRFACCPCDRVGPLMAGDVRAEGIDLDITPFHNPRELFDRVLGGEFDVAELSSSHYITAVSEGDTSLAALPVFLSRAFRHSYIVINRHAGIREPRDLRGKRIGVPQYTMSAAIWTMGTLEDEYGVDLSAVTWVQGAMDKAGAHGRHMTAPRGSQAKLEINESAYSLSELLARNDIDATLGAVMPDGFRKNPDLQRLFPDFREAEKDYYRRTRIHPIMHLAVIRRSVLDREPWIAKSLFAALERSKELAWESVLNTHSYQYMLPWLVGDLDEIETLCDGDPWPYGLKKNSATLAKAIDYLHRYHVIARKPTLDELFLNVGA